VKPQRIDERARGGQVSRPGDLYRSPTMGPTDRSRELPGSTRKPRSWRRRLNVSHRRCRSVP